MKNKNCAVKRFAAQFLYKNFVRFNIKLKEK